MIILLTAAMLNNMKIFFFFILMVSIFIIIIILDSKVYILNLCYPRNNLLINIKNAPKLKLETLLSFFISFTFWVIYLYEYFKSSYPFLNPNSIYLPPLLFEKKKRGVRSFLSVNSCDMHFLFICYNFCAEMTFVINSIFFLFFP